MKKNVCIVLGLSLIFLVSMVHINANEAKKENIKYPTNYLSEWNENDKVIQLPDGGYLKGEAILHKEDGIVIVYNSETDSDAMTVKEVRESFAK